MFIELTPATLHKRVSANSSPPILKQLFGHRFFHTSRATRTVMVALHIAQRQPNR